MAITLLKKKKKVMLQTQTILQHFYKQLCHFSNFQIIIDKLKCDVSGGLILKIIRIFHINSL